MFRIKISLFIGLAVAYSVSVAQDNGAAGYYNDALLLGRTNALSGSTARMQGLAGAQSSLGADMSVAGINPAGLGFFNRSVFSFTPSLNFESVVSNYQGSAVSTYGNNVSVPNFGIVFNNQNRDFGNSEFKGGSFAITFSKLNDFNSESWYQGRNNFNSIVDSFLELENSNIQTSYSDMAYSHFLIDNAKDYYYEDGSDGKVYIHPSGSDANIYSSVVGADSYDGWLPRQTERTVTSGGQNALNFAWGGNYADKMYFGAGLSYITLNYKQNRIYTEDDFVDRNDNPDYLLNKIEINDDLNIYGNGIGFNVGLIFRPADFITLGISHQSPKYYSLQSEQSFEFTTDWNSGYVYHGYDPGTGDSAYFDMDRYTDYSDVTYTNYNLKSAPITTLGATVFLGKAGFISGDVEIADYSNQQLKGQYIPQEDNAKITQLYGSTVNVRLGGEFRLDVMRLRAGIAHYGDPYKNNSVFDGSSTAYTFGAGIRKKNHFLDFALVNQSSMTAISPYQIGFDQPIAEVNTRQSNFTATVGFNF